MKNMSLFSQLLNFFSKSTFSSLVEKHKTEYCSKGFGSWSQFVSMLFCQLGKASSLREISYGLQSCEGKLSPPQNAIKTSLGEQLRLIKAFAVNGKEMFFLTNNRELSAQTISDIYRERWQIETFFKEIKQNLKIKTFVGTTENAVMTQIYTALISILLPKYLKLKSSYNWSMSNLAVLLRMNLFTQKTYGNGLVNHLKNLLIKLRLRLFSRN